MTATPIAAPRCTRMLALASMILSVLWVILYFVAVIFQRQYLSLYAASAEMLKSFVIPISPLVSYLALWIAQMLFCILLLTSAKKPVWTRGKGAGMLIAGSVLLVLSGVLKLVLPLLEGELYAQYGATMLATYSVVNTGISNFSGIMTAASICAMIAVSILTYQAALSRRNNPIQEVQE